MKISKTLSEMSTDEWSMLHQSLTLQLTPVQLEVLTTALENPDLADLLASDNEQGEKLTKSLLEMKQTTKALSQMVNERGFGYEDNFGGKLE